eukprot:contig_22662_g5594
MVRLLVVPGLPSTAPEVRLALTVPPPGLAASPMVIGLADRRRRFGPDAGPDSGDAVVPDKTAAVLLQPRNRKRGRKVLGDFPQAPITLSPAGAGSVAGVRRGGASGKDESLLAAVHPRKGVLLARQSMLALLYARHYGMVTGAMVRARKLHLELLR